MNCHRVAKIGQLGWGQLCHTAVMTTKTIPAYLEDERQKNIDAQVRIQEDAARVQPLHGGHHRTAKQPKRDLPSPVEAAAKARQPAAAARKKPRAKRKTVAKARKAA
jgi:hypothetical protein